MYVSGSNLANRRIYKTGQLYNLFSVVTKWPNCLISYKTYMRC